MQHFIPYSFSKDQSEETKNKNLFDTQRKDKIKNDYCVKNNINILRISYLEKNNIKKILDECIN